MLPSAVIDSNADDDASFDIGLSLRLVTGEHALERPARRRGRAPWCGARNCCGSAPPMPRPRPATPYQLVLLPSSCQLQRFVVKLLDEHKVPYLVSHSASGVAGLQLALKAGLGISCLNESSIGGGRGRLSRRTSGCPRCPPWSFICCRGGSAKANASATHARP